MHTDRSEPAPTLSLPDALAFKEEVKKTCLEFFHSWGARGEGILEKHSAMFHPDISGFGTGVQERINRREDIVALLQQEHEQLPQGLTVEVDWINVYPLSTTAAMAEGEVQILVTLPDGTLLTMPCRMSLVWVLQDDAWLLKHGHLSFPSSDQAAEEAFPLDALRARNEELERQVAERTAALEAAKNEVEEALDHLRITQAQLIQQEKMVSLGQLTAGIAHEIKNPLNFVNNFAALSCELVDELKAETDPEEIQAILADLKMNAEKIEHHGRRADGIVHAMMQHASGGTGQRESTQIDQLVSEHIDLAYHGRRGRSPTHESKRAQMPDLQVEIARNLGFGTHTAEIVPREIGRVLLNLLGNAFDAVHEHASNADGPYEPVVTVSTAGSDGQVEIRVSDNGPGVPADIREKIFEPFFTTKPTGQGSTGLGLSLSYDIVTQGHGGTLVVESEEGEGATFIVTLPVNPEMSGWSG